MVVRRLPVKRADMILTDWTAMDVLELLEVIILAGPCVINILFDEGIDILRG